MGDFPTEVRCGVILDFDESSDIKRVNLVLFYTFFGKTPPQTYHLLLSCHCRLPLPQRQFCGNSFCAWNVCGPHRGRNTTQLNLYATPGQNRWLHCDCQPDIYTWLAVKVKWHRLLRRVASSFPHNATSTVYKDQNARSSTSSSVKSIYCWLITTDSLPENTVQRRKKTSRQPYVLQMR